MIVADCSVLVDALTAADADHLVELIAEERVAAPILIDYEFVSAVRGLTLGQHLSKPRALDALSDFEALQIERWALPDVLRRRVFELRHNLTAYDASYVALAEALDCALMTRDQRLASAAQDTVVVTLV